jgi:hypothetical protein
MTPAIATLCLFFFTGIKYFWNIGKIEIAKRITALYFMA